MDTIAFAIPGASVHTIRPLSALPALTDPAGVHIDGYTQPGTSRNSRIVGDNARLRIELDGSRAGSSADGLHLVAGANQVEGLTINRFGRYGVFATTSTGNVLTGNYIGTDPTGTLDRGNGGAGVFFQSDAPGNRVGGTTPAARNVISGNNASGIEVRSRGNVLQGNYVGVTAGGNVALPNIGNVNRGAINDFNEGNTIAGNVISGNTGNGILLYNATLGFVSPTPTFIQGNLIGLGADGRTALGNHIYGIYLALDSRQVTIGGATPAARNVISDNGGFGVILDVGAANATIQGNYIGTDASGLHARGNRGQGIYDFGTTGLHIGGATARPGTGRGNVISANTGSGLLLGGSAGLIQGNVIGLAADGATALGGQTIGVYLSGAGNSVGGATASLRNVISGNADRGVLLEGAANNRIAGNYIGVDVSGALPRGNGTGVDLDRGAHDNVIGGTAGNRITANLGDGVRAEDAAGNLIAGNSVTLNGFAGVLLGAGTARNVVGGTTAAARNILSGNHVFGVEIGGGEGAAQADVNVVQGNFIGLDASGFTALANGIGVALNGNVKGTLIADNFISGNVNYGVSLVGPSTRNNQLLRNFIGTTGAGRRAGNGLDGVLLNSGAHDNVIGLPGSGNVIVYNGGSGVAVGLAGLGSASTGNSIRGNSIHDNTGLGIDLGSDGVTLNDPLDTDIGPNGLQNFPVLTAAEGTGSGTSVAGTLDSLAGARFTIDLYASPSADASGHAQGQLYLGSCVVVADGSGHGAFTCTLPVVPAGWVIAATATGPGGDTSEFSSPIAV
jgi:titin